jgi:exonuclease VII large subunit
MHRREVEAGLRTLHGLHPRRVLKRGFTFCKAPEGGSVIGRSKGITKDDRIEVNFYDGTAICRVDKKRKGTAWPRR